MPNLDPRQRFDAKNWMWKANDGRIYSSARNSLLHPNDPLITAFAQQYGGIPPWPIDANGQQTTDALAAVLANYGMTISI
jgi:hypothetical protein